ncbi:stage II sporulation protein M [Gordoniibacillus kamchatkensis]|nr:stage II sporulation protein M [Paenibacillus sp. VKM B-2647]
MNKYFVAAAAVFIAGFVLGIEGSGRYAGFIEQQLKGLEHLASTVQNKPNPQLWLFVLIFLNNVCKSLIFVYFGLFFGVLPIGVLVVNGMILGYVASAQAHNQSWWYVAKGILPHGIIEIPAVIIACAYGIRLGFIVLKGVGSPFVPGLGTRVRGELIHTFKMTLPLAGLLTCALLVAAAIESTVTYWLVK